MKAGLSNFLVQTKYKEIPMSKYSKVHTGPKTQFGGLNDGFTRDAYQVGMEAKVNMDPINPASWQIRIAKKSCFQFIVKIISDLFFRRFLLHIHEHSKNKEHEHPHNNANSKNYQWWN